MSITRWIVAAALCLSAPAVAQQPPPAGTPPAGTPSTAPLSDQWEKLPRMQLEQTFAGPLRDTIVQRWRDASEGVVCYTYLPITAPITPTQSGFVQYGPNTIGSISCVNAGAPGPSTAPRQPPRPSPAPKAASPSPAPPPAR